VTLLIHPGFHKTGTTWLQDELFSDTRIFKSLMTHADVDRTIVAPHDFMFDPDAARDRIVAQSVADGRINVISSEILTGSPFYGMREGRSLVERLHRIAPDARILLTVRAQLPVLRAHYQQYVKRGGMLKPAAFYQPDCEPGYTGFDLDMMQYHLFAEYYAQLFGADNVLVLPQEVMAKDPDAFFAALTAFIGFDAVAAGDGWNPAVSNCEPVPVDPASAARHRRPRMARCDPVQARLSCAYRLCGTASSASRRTHAVGRPALRSV
jgi:hypothetical protein